jgi:hypothetical protein
MRDADMRYNPEFDRWSVSMATPIMACTAESQST